MAYLILDFIICLNAFVLSDILYSETYATRALNFAYAAYCHGSDIQKWECKWCNNIPNFDISILYETDHLLGYTGYDRDLDQIVVVFRGTHNIYDWLKDIDYQQIPYPNVLNGWIHRGFYKSWTELAPKIFNDTTKLMNQYKHKAILITGHSLGAALAQISSMDIKNYAIQTNNNADIILYHYGSPRWANKVLIDYFQGLISQNFRIVNKKDIVPTVPYINQGKYQYHHSRLLSYII